MKTTPNKFLQGRACCPCCGYPTLEANADYEICELCNWEDDGQSDADADEIRGGPNADYSLSEARLNFRKYGVMYSPDRDTRITGADSDIERRTKALLIEAFDALPSATDRDDLIREIKRLENVLTSELHRQIKEYEARIRS